MTQPPKEREDGGPKLSPAQKRALLETYQHPLELFEIYGPRGLAHSSQERMAQRLCEAGLFEPYVHGGWCLTDVGRDTAARHSPKEG